VTQPGATRPTRRALGNRLRTKTPHRTIVSPGRPQPDPVVWSACRFVPISKDPTTTTVCVCAPPGRRPYAGAVASPADVARRARQWIATVAVVDAGSAVILTADILSPGGGARRAARKLAATVAACCASDAGRLTADCWRDTGAEVGGALGRTATTLAPARARLLQRWTGGWSSPLP
jgi:hypothetical protein